MLRTFELQIANLADNPTFEPILAMSFFSLAVQFAQFSDDGSVNARLVDAHGYELSGLDHTMVSL